MKKYLIPIMMAVFVFIAILPMQILAAETESIDLQVNGKETAVVVTLPQAVGEKTSSLQLSLKVEAAKLDELSVSFTFQEGIEGKVMEYRYNKNTGMLNVYIAGKNPLFTEDSLQLGNVSIETTDKNGVTARVSVVENSLKVVKGTKTEDISIMNYPTPVEVVIGNGGNQVETSDVDNGSHGGESDTDNGNQGGESDTDNGNQGGGSDTDNGNQGGESDTDNGNQGGESDTDNGDTGLADKTSLEQLLQLADGYKKSDYTAESYAVFQEALINAQNIFNNPLASQGDIEEAIVNLENAIGALQTSNNPVNPEDDNTSNNGESVNTGDNNAVLLYIITLMIGGVVLLGCAYRKLRRS